jgi:hypothetical protein
VRSSTWPPPSSCTLTFRNRLSSSNTPSSLRCHLTATYYSEIVGPSSTLLRDYPSSNHTVYSYGSATDPMLFRKYCGTLFYHDGVQNALSVNVAIDSLDNCIDLCASYNTQNRFGIADGSSTVCQCSVLAQHLRHRSSRSVLRVSDPKLKQWMGICNGGQ